jgi:uncharacterized protein YgiM (DUF1202 family)
MKKILVLLLVLAMAITMFASCSSCKEGSDKPDAGTTDGGNENPNPDKDGFTKVEKTMYVYITAANGEPNTASSLNIRETPSAEEGVKILGSLPFGAEVKVTGENEELGWFRIDYNGAVGYVNAKFLANEKPEVENPEDAEVITEDKFETVNETVYIYATSYDKETKKDVHQHDVEKVNAYSRPYASDWSSKSDSWLANHVSVTRVGVYYEKEDDPSYGWSKLSVVMEEGKEPVIVYVRNSQIIAELPAECTAAPEAPADTSAQ